MVFPYKWFRLPWAVAGTKAAIPDPTQGDGTCSYNEGFGADYSLDPATNPSALLIPRDKTNELYYDITQALQYIQSGKFPAWIDASTNGGVAYPYAIGDIALYTDGLIYQSLTAANVTTPGTDITKWVVVGGASGHQYQSGTYATDSGAANAYVIAPLPALAGYVGGQVFRFIPTNQNTGASTINISALGVKSIVRPDGTALLPGDIPATGLVEIVYQATLGKFVLNSVASKYLNAASGYLRVPGSPFILQWKAYSLTPGNTTNCPTGAVWGTVAITWPLAFPNGALAAWASPIITVNGQYQFALTGALTQAGCDVYHNAWGSATFPASGVAFAIGT